MDIIDKFCRYFVNNNVEKFLSLFTDYPLYNDCLYGLFKGKEEIKNFYLKCHKEASNYHFSPTNKMLYGNTGAFEWDFSFLSNMPLAKGKKISLKGCSFLSLEKGKIQSYRDYCDSILFLLQGNVDKEKIIKFFIKKYKLSHF